MTAKHDRGSRKSTEHGLDQEFNSLDAQREASEAYVKSQASQGWKALSQEYDDPAYSGGNLERPALKRLLRDIEAGRIDVIVVYKIDRLTRSLADFAKLVEAFDAKSISFVAVTQQFNTTTMGVDGLVRQKSICDNQSHHARENQQGREGFSDHWPGRIARSRWSGLRFKRPLEPDDIALFRRFACLGFGRLAHASHLAVISAVDLANGQGRGLGLAHRLESGSIVSQKALCV